MAGKALTVHRCPTDEAMPKLAGIFSKSKTDTCGGLCDVADQVKNAQCFVVRNQGGEDIGHYAVRVNHYAHGDEVVVIAAAGLMPGADLVASLIPYIEQQSQGAKALTVHTRRRGLLAKLGALGFQCEGYILRKALP